MPGRYLRPWASIIEECFIPKFLKFLTLFLGGYFPLIVLRLFSSMRYIQVPFPILLPWQNFVDFLFFNRKNGKSRKQLFGSSDWYCTEFIQNGIDWVCVYYSSRLRDTANKHRVFAHTPQAGPHPACRLTGVRGFRPIILIYVQVSASEACHTPRVMTKAITAGISISG